MGQKNINGDLNVTGAIKHNGTEINYSGGIENYEVISQVNALPTATATSPDFVQYNGELYKKVATSLIIDLTNTTWTFNLNITPVDEWWRINFTSNNTSFNDLLVERADGSDSRTYIQYGETMVYYGEGDAWTNSAYKTIQITGGTDATNSTLISWLQNNATLTSPTPISYSYELVNTVGMTNPMTNAGDLIIGGSSGTPTRLAKGTAGQVLKSTADGLEWSSDSGGTQVTFVDWS